MAVKRIVTNFAGSDPHASLEFYRDLLGLRVAMDMGWIVTLEADATAQAQLSILSEGGSGAPVPDVSIEVDDFDAVLARLLNAGLQLEYGPLDEPWGVRRFFVRDPLGRLVNLLEHDLNTRARDFRS
jgi:catechol 2,3-dioxygenase-like lactoylglutathione lyase family enzyme